MTLTDFFILFFYWENSQSYNHFNQEAEEKRRSHKGKGIRPTEAAHIPKENTQKKRKRAIPTK